MKKNELVEINIEQLNNEAEGLGHTAANDLVIVKGALPGDRVLARITQPGWRQNIATIAKIIHPAPARIKAPCPIAAQCGACQLQVLAYPEQLRWKQEKVADFFEKAGLSGLPVLPTLGMDRPWHYRNKTQLPIAKTHRGHYVTGFFADHSHQLIPQDDCLLVSKTANKISKIILSFLENEHIPLYDEKSGQGLVRYLLIRQGTYSGEWLVCLVINGRQLPKSQQLVAALRQIPGMTSISLSINTARTNAIMGSELQPLFGPLYINDRIGELTFRIGPLSFFQINPWQTRVLYNTALEFAGLTGRENVWDLYCGAGTISLFLAQKAHWVRGVEIIPEAVENARENARINGLQNTTFYVGKAEEVVPRVLAAEQPATDVVVVDPPRKGCEQKLLETILQMAPDKVVYVSCNPATLARDAAFLCQNGPYQVARIQPVDMFPQTSHVETVALITRKDK